MLLVVFDVDGTLVDSQAHIVAAMQAAFAEGGHVVPDRATILSIVGLSLPLAIETLTPGTDPATRDRMVAAYRDAFVALRSELGEGASPLYPGALDTLAALGARDDVLLGIATGKSQRGLDLLLDHYDLRRRFVTAQSADGHPSKPHPAMLETALAEAGVAPAQAVMLGDTTYDMLMAANAGVAGIGVAWGYHPAEALTGAGAETVLGGFEGLLPHLTETGRLA
jgi:phosphoglycolate phosphatase